MTHDTVQLIFGQSPTAPFSTICSWNIAAGTYVMECHCNSVVCLCRYVDYSGSYPKEFNYFQESRYWVNSQVESHASGKCEAK